MKTDEMARYVILEQFTNGTIVVIGNGKRQPFINKALVERRIEKMNELATNAHYSLAIVQRSSNKESK